MLQLFLTGWMTEIAGRTTHIMNIAFKIRLPDHLPGLGNDRFMASCLQNPSLMKCQRTEAAATKAAAVAGQAELDLLQCRHTTSRLVGRMIRPHIRQRIDII